MTIAPNTAVAWLCGGGSCSDDSFSDFRAWLISRGRAVYDAVLRNADELIDEIGRSEHSEFEAFGSIPGQVYHERTGRALPDLDLGHPPEPSGGEWLRAELKDRTGSPLLNRCIVFREMGSEEFAAIQTRFPRVWRHCVQEGIIRVAKPGPGEPAESERIQTPEEVARTMMDPNLAKTDFPAYLKALADAARQEYSKRKGQS